MVEFKCEECGKSYWCAVILGDEPVCPECGSKTLPERKMI